MFFLLLFSVVYCSDLSSVIYSHKPEHIRRYISSIGSYWIFEDNIDWDYIKKHQNKNFKKYCYDEFLDDVRKYEDFFINFKYVLLECNEIYVFKFVNEKTDLKYDLKFYKKYRKYEDLVDKIIKLAGYIFIVIIMLIISLMCIGFCTKLILKSF